MWRFLGVITLAVLIGSDARAQPPRGSSSDEVRKLEAELNKLQGMIKDIEAKLKAAKEDSDRGRDGRARGFGGFGPPGGPSMFGRSGGRGGRGWGFGPPGGPPMRRPGDDRRPETEKKDDGEKKPETERPEPRSFNKNAEIEKRLDKLAAELEELRRELRRR